jgi:protein-disulfide isomerase
LNKRQKRRQAQAQKRKRRQTFIVLGTLGLAAAAFLLFTANQAPAVSQARLEDNPIYGAVDAPITITEYGDFTCSACRTWHQAGAIFDLVDQNEGLVRLVWRDFPVITADSPYAAEAGQCAHDQGQFWEFLDRVYNEPGSSYTNARPDNLDRYAQDIGLDMADFTTCLDENTHQATVDFDLEFARSWGFTGTPSFMVNGTPIIGGSPEAIAQAVQVELLRLEQ